jgi:GT2 family glycosyltransferase
MKRRRSERRKLVHRIAASILIINYNGARHLPGCLDALQLQTAPRHCFEVILLDNSSSDNSVSLIEEQFSWVRLVKSARNLGFAEGNNLAATFAHSSRLILLNNDTIPDPHWLEELLRVSNEFPYNPVVSKLVFAHDPRLIQSAGLILLRDGRGTDYGFRAQDLGQFEETRPVFAGCGAALLVPAPRPGEMLFDPVYFMYYEDMQLGWAAQLQGDSTIYAARAVVKHVHGATSSESTPFFLFHVERNRALTSLRHGDWLLASLAAPGLFLRTFREVMRAIRRPQARPVAVAFVRASLSFGWLAPRVIYQRLTRTFQNLS